MVTSAKNEKLLFEAIGRLATGDAIRSRDDLLVDRNLILEAGVSKATLYRCSTAMEHWKAVKERAVSAAIEALKAAQAGSPSRDLTDADLMRAARVDYASFCRMPDAIVDEWNGVKARRPLRSRRELAKNNPDDVINSLVNKLYATTLALRQAKDVIARQAAEIDRLGGNVVPIR